MAFQTPAGIFAKRVRGKGLGVFARRRFDKGDEIERVPVIVLPTSELAAHPDSVLGRYAFTWDDRHLAMALGYGSLYNHNPSPNASHKDTAPRTKIFFAVRDIEAGEEITIDYLAGSPGGDLGFPIR